ncbi:hypothetical protein SDC9_194936 [bioreactor metagenome]|uniref:Uncharacterized protein n=1 Tax=bioreactor metagenome TaxID=1076179 RepID=A0A645IGA8_9ZZZZ
MPSLAVNGFLQGDEVPVITCAESTNQIHTILEKLARLTVEHNEKFDPYLMGGGNQTCLYFCCLLPDDLIRGKRCGSLEVVACFPGETGLNQLGCRVVSIHEFIGN